MVQQLRKLIKTSLGGTETGRKIIVGSRDFITYGMGVVGHLFLYVLPKKAESLKQNEFNFSKRGERHGMLNMLLRAGLIHRAITNNDEKELESYHYNFWQSKSGFHYHNSQRHAFEEFFLGHFGDEVMALLTQKAPSYPVICEIGTGTGQLLNYLASSLPETERFIGIDLSPDMIADNKQRYDNPKLEFVVASGNEWIEENGEPNWVFITNRGVLEYFLHSKVEALFNHISQNLSPAIFITIEPVSVDHVLETELDSKPYGREFSFSHNYPYLFQKAGFHLYHTSQQTYFDHYLCLFIAATDNLNDE